MRDTFFDRDCLKRNHFGALRLLLAAAVLFSHAFAAYVGKHADGEHLYVWTKGQMDLGALAVNAFFAISGCLITISWLRAPDLRTFMAKRVLRIYPGFIIASLVSLLIVAPLSGAQWSVAFTPTEIVKSIARIVLLSGPKAIGSFASEPVPVLNMSLWTIRYEFLCYLLVPLIVALLSVRHARIGVTILYVLALCWHGAQGEYFAETGKFDIPILGSGDVWPRFLAYFFGGMVMAFNRDIIPFRNWIALLCVIAMLVTAVVGGFFLATATAGIYLIFYIAYQQRVPSFGIGDKVDLSYGVYLYAWPVQMLLIQNLRDTFGPWTILALTVPAVAIVAAMSWYFIEAPFMSHKAMLLRQRTPIMAPVTALEIKPEPGAATSQPRLVFSRSTRPAVREEPAVSHRRSA